MTITRLSTLAACGTLAVALGLTGSAQQSQPPPAADQKAPIAELWIEPEGERDLFYGVGGKALAPDPAEKYTVIELKVGGFSEGYTVVDDKKREWSTKFPPEAATEVALGRLHWGIGYHQPPAYLLPEWNAKGARRPNPQLPSRFREKSPDFHGLDSGDPWAFDENPFVGTRQLRGVLALQAIFENPDIKPSNNTIYTLKTPFEGASRWYVVRDLGYALGRASFNGPRGDIDAYERAPFIRDVVDGKVRFHYAGRYKGLLEDITVEDVVWICERLNKLTDRQWRDAFRAGGFEPSIGDRFIARIKARVAEGLALGNRPAARRTARN